MNNYQTSILWLGLILVALNVIVNIGQFKSVVFSGPSTTAQTVSQQNASSAMTQNTPSSQLV